MRSVQTVSGTGANHLGALFLHNHLKPKSVFIPKETWANHHLVWEVAAPTVERKTYPYYGEEGKLDFEGLISCLEFEAQPGDVILLHPCCHNPTGIDPSHSQWAAICDMVKRKQLFAFFDAAYQGFSSGDPDADAWSVRHFIQEVFSGSSDCGPIGMCVAQSFSKNFGLYGERVGAFHLIVGPSVSAEGAFSQLKRLSRAEISNPPLYGSSIVRVILTTPRLRALWESDLKTMTGRLRKVRSSLAQALREQGASGDWGFLESQVGMFSLIPRNLLDEEQIAQLREKHHVYLLKSGRISVTGLTDKNIAYVAQAILKVTK